MSKTNEKYTNEEILSLKEAVQHGDFLLPFDIYRTRMPEYFNSFPMHWHEEIEIVYQNYKFTSLSVSNNMIGEVKITKVEKTQQ